MSQNNIKDQVLKVISKHRLGVLSTVENNKPHLRYMTFFNDALTLYTPTKKDTEKIEEIENNPACAVLLGFEDKGQEDAYVQITGTASINESHQLKTKLWDESFNQWFKGKEDPNYVLIQIQPQIIRILNMKGDQIQELTI